MAAEWDPLRSAFAYRVKVQHGLFDSDEVVARAIRKDVEYTKLIKMKARDALYFIVEQVYFCPRFPQKECTTFQSSEV